MHLPNLCAKCLWAAALNVLLDQNLRVLVADFDNLVEADDTVRGGHLFTDEPCTKVVCDAVEGLFC